MPLAAEPVDVDLVQVRRALAVLSAPGEVVEIRAIDVHRGGRVNKIVSGYFDDHELAAQAAAKLSGCSTGVYLVMNALNPALLARRVNRVDVAGHGETTSDHDILRRHWLLVDVDARRPTKISATDGEVSAAKELRDRIVRDLCSIENGWPTPVLADSGNGAHALWRVDLPRDDAGLVERTLKGLAARYDQDDVKVDTSVHNPARITKLYGTLARKGDQTKDRPWRWSRITETPGHVYSVAPELLERLALPAPGAKPSGSRDAWTQVDDELRSGQGAFDVRLFVERHLESLGEWRHDSRTGGELIDVVCPFNPDHATGEAVVGVMPSGAYWFKCQHNSCQDKKWREVREQYEPRPAQAPSQAWAPAAAPSEGFARALEIALADVKNALGVEKASARVPLFGSAADLFLRDYPATPWLVSGLISKGGVAMVGAEPKSGKTWALAEIAVAVATGTPVCGEFFATQGTVAYFFAEDLAVQVRNRLRALTASRGMGPAHLGRLHVCPRGQFLDVTRDDDLAWVVASCRELGPLDLLVLDPLRDISSAAEDKSDEMSPVMRRLRLMGELLGCTVAVAHHAGKATADTAKRRPGQRMRGSGAIHGATDSGIYLGLRAGDGIGRFELDVDSEVKGARSAGAFELELVVEDDVEGAAISATWTVSRGGRERQKDEKQQNDTWIRAAQIAIVGLLAESAVPLSRNQIRVALGLRRETTLAAIEALMASGKVVEVKGKRLGGSWPLWTPARAMAAGVEVVPAVVTGSQGPQ